MTKRASKKRFPETDTWFSNGAHSAHDGDKPPTLEEAIKKYQPPAEYIDAFTRGYLRGRITSATMDFGFWLKYLDNDQLQRLGDALLELRDKFDEELSRPDATYKVKGVFDE